MIYSGHPTRNRLAIIFIQNVASVFGCLPFLMGLSCYGSVVIFSFLCTFSLPYLTNITFNWLSLICCCSSSCCYSGSCWCHSCSCWCQIIVYVLVQPVIVVPVRAAPNFLSYGCSCCCCNFLSLFVNSCCCWCLLRSNLFFSQLKVILIDLLDGFTPIYLDPFSSIDYKALQVIYAASR